MAVLEELQNKEEEEEFLEQVEQFKRDVAEERKKYEPSTAEKIFSGRFLGHKVTYKKGTVRVVGGGGLFIPDPDFSTRIPDLCPDPGCNNFEVKNL